jgi:HEAT repeat protein
MKNDAEVKIGNWYTICCQRDLRKIVDQSNIDLIISLQEDNIGVRIYNTKIEALLDIKRSYENRKENLLYADQIKDLDEEIEDCNRMIREEESIVMGN